MTTTKTKRLVESAIMVALAAVLSLIKIWKMPLEGSVTLLSMLPICLLSIRYGVKWGLFVSAFYSVVQIALDLSSLMTWGMTVRIYPQYRRGQQIDRDLPPWRNGYILQKQVVK